MDTLETSAGSMLFFGGLWTGAIVMVALERSRSWLLMPIDQYVADFRRSLLRIGPLLSGLGLLAAISAGIFASRSAGEARLLAEAGVAGFVLIVIASIVGVAPIESKFRRCPPGEIPEHADSYRAFWCRFHLGRTLLALVIFGSFVASSVQTIR